MRRRGRGDGLLTGLLGADPVGIGLLKACNCGRMISARHLSNTLAILSDALSTCIVFIGNNQGSIMPTT
jgi:hypothetical protein